MNIYQDAVGEAITFWSEVLTELLAEPVDREAIRARYDELKGINPQQFLVEYGPQEMLKQEGAVLAATAKYAALSKEHP